jgi:chorismate dehydratase
MSIYQTQSQSGAGLGLNSALAPTITPAPQPTNKPKLGQICFANCLPIVLPFQHGLIDLAADTTFASPAELNALFAAGQLDVGAMSSFYYLSQNNLELLPDVSISCTGSVGSVLFFGKHNQIAKVDTYKVSGSKQSATSINLLRILFHKEFGFIPEIIPDPTPSLQDSEINGALVIGDKALAVDAEWSKSFDRIDLGKWWVDTYKLPMVFGVWAARQSWARDNKNAHSSVVEAHRQAREIGLTSHFKAVLQEGHSRTGLSAERLSTYYLQELDFRLTPDHLRGLDLFRKLCLELDLF